MTETRNVRDALAESVRRLGARADAELLLMHALGVDRAWLFAHATDAIGEAAWSCFDALIERRERGEPVAYILEQRGFWNLQLRVTPATLIPRPETELLVELALERMPVDTACDVVDLGTGSGAIALALASERPLARVTATDISTDALDVARANARAADLTRVEFVQGAWCAPLAGRRFDLIVSNPPYIEDADAHLRQSDLRYEPRSALASGVDGLDAVRRITAGAGEHLVAGGWLLFEHGWKQAAAARALLLGHGFTDVHTQQDLEQRDRVTLGRVQQKV
jgi:release factor glutamine methyltransferase